jgi:hypothetical protein
VKPRKMRWDGHVAGEVTNANKILIIEPEGKRPQADGIQDEDSETNVRETVVRV